MANYKTVTTQIEQKSHEDTSQRNKQHNTTKMQIYMRSSVLIKYLNILGQTDGDTKVQQKRCKMLV
jgi:hypothetical protein